MRHDPYSAPTTQLEVPTQGTVSMVRYGLLCFLGLGVTLGTLVLVNLFAAVPIPTGIGIAALLVAIHFASWRFVHIHRRVMSRAELKEFALICATAFWTFDELPALIARFSGPDTHIVQNIFTVLLASGFDVVLAVAMVYFTVPWVSRYFRPRLAQGN